MFRKKSSIRSLSFGSVKQLWEKSGYNLELCKEYKNFSPNGYCYYRGSSYLSLAFMYGNDDLAKALIKHGASLLNERDVSGTTSLHWASAKSKDILWLMPKIKMQGIIDVRNNRGYAPLHWAVANNNLPNIRTLLIHGASLENPSDLNISSPYEMAKCKGYMEAACILKLHEDMSEWRPDNHVNLSLPYRNAMRTLLLLTYIYK